MVRTVGYGFRCTRWLVVTGFLGMRAWPMVFAGTKAIEHGVKGIARFDESACRLPRTGLPGSEENVPGTASQPVSPKAANDIDSRVFN